MKTIKDINVVNKTVLVRCDLNVPIDNGEITDDTRILKCLETLNYLIERKCKIIILSHFGRIKNDEDKVKYNLNIVASRLSDLLKKRVFFLNENYSGFVKDYVIKSPDESIILLQNTRYADLDGKLESNNDLKLSFFWASLADVFINDAFASSHRLHASVSGICRFLPSAIGLLIENEIKGLEPIKNLSNRPFTVFMGGAKVEDKLPIIKKILPKCDYILLGGGILNSFLKAKGVDVKDSLCTNDSNILNELKELLTIYQHKIYLTEKLIWKADKIYDIDISDYMDVINVSKLIFVNGTPGIFEDNKYNAGTINLFNALKTAKAKVIIGGGDTINALNKFGFENNFYFISSGGGATLEYIANGYLSALKQIEDDKFVVVNYKNKLNKENVAKYLNELKNMHLNNTNLIVCPDELYLDLFTNSPFILGSQDVILNNKEILYTLVGHHEKRKMGDDINIINNKINMLNENNIIPILCIGESIAEKNDVYSVIEKQITDVLDLIKIKNIIIAYEPIWAIGTNKLLSSNEISVITNHIKNFIYSRYNLNLKVLYGGSVDDKNISSLVSIKKLDGILISSAALNLESLKTIIETCDK